MFYAPAVPAAQSSINLAATLAASSSGLGDPLPGPHFPLACQGPLELGEDNSLACEHTRVPAGDPRTQACIDHSVAILLLELLREKERP
jgi:hypothetical protein